MTANLPIRVMVEDAWDQVTLDLPPGTPVEEAKRRALTMTHVARNPGDYMVKYRGAEVDEGRSLAETGVVANAPLIVMARHRRPVR